MAGGTESSEGGKTVGVQQDGAGNGSGCDQVEKEEGLVQHKGRGKK